MDVCMFVYNSFRHDARVLKEARTLTAAGHHVRVVARLDPTTQAKEVLEDIRVVRVDTDPLPTRLARAALLRRPGGGRSSSPGWGLAGGSMVERKVLRLHLSAAWLKYARRALAVALREPADLWVAHDLDTLPLAALARRWLGGGLLYDSHELFLERTFFPPLTRFRRWWWTLAERRLISEADVVVTVNRLFADELAGRYGIPRPVVVENRPDAEQRRDPAYDLRAELRLPAGRPVVLYLGGLQPHRGLEELLQAAARLPGYGFVIRGPGDPGYVASLESSAMALGLLDRVRIVPPVPLEDVVRCAAGADVGMVAHRNTDLSYRLTSPNKLFDYIAAGVPVVAGDSPGVAHVIRNHDVGVLCDPADPADVARAIGQLVEDREGYERRRANCRRAASELTWQPEGEKLVAAAAAALSAARPA